MKNADARKLVPEAQEAIRLRVVNFLKTGKGTQRQAAEIFQISLRAIEKIWKRYKEGGSSALRAKKRGPQKRTALLSTPRVKQVKRLIKAGTPDSYGLPSFLWTADAVRRLIKKKQG